MKDFGNTTKRIYTQKGIRTKACFMNRMATGEKALNVLNNDIFLLGGHHELA
jgi:hypothetical protein